MTRAGSFLSVLVALASPASPAAAGHKILYGVTIDRITHLGQIQSGLKALPEPSTVRVVFDRSEPPSYYARATHAISQSSSVMGELLDSSAERPITAQQMRTRTQTYLHALGASVAIWEVGNELNGNWTGPYSQVSAKAQAAFSVVHAAGARTAITLYANDFAPQHCGDGASELTPAQFAKTYLPASLRDHLDYLLLSYYPTQCRGVEPSSSVVATHLRALHALFPHARVGFGEIGLPNPVDQTTLHKAQHIMSWAYGLDPDLSYYAGGYFWWYGAEDVLRPGAPLRNNLANAFNAERSALSPRS